jgi:hypothetical protein
VSVGDQGGRPAQRAGGGAGDDLVLVRADEVDPSADLGEPGRGEQRRIRLGVPEALARCGGEEDLLGGEAYFSRSSTRLFSSTDCTKIGALALSRW